MVFASRFLCQKILLINEPNFEVSDTTGAH